MNENQRLMRILADVRETAQRGEAVDIDRVIREHPDLESELRSRLAALGALREGFEGLRDEETSSPTQPREIGEYRIIREIGRGGMGVVYEAEQMRMKRMVALKVLSVSITSSPQAVRRFQREAQAAGRLHHTNIVPVYDLDQFAGEWFYAMELVEGRSLSDVIAELRGRRPTERGLGRAAMAATDASEGLSGTGTGDRAYYLRVAELFEGVASALELAHQEGVVHRDVKPSNLLLDADGVLKIVDFGLARFDDEALSMTMTGDLLGTPQYMSPEQAMAKRMGIDHRTDIYSLGATLYEVLTLEPPFDARNLQQLCSQIITKDPTLPRKRNHRIPRDLETIVCKAMEKDRDKRYQSAREFARDLRSFADGGTIRARRIGPAGRAWRQVKRHKVRSSLAAAVLVLAVVGGVLGWQALEESARRTEREYFALCGRGFDETLRLGSEDRVRFLELNDESAFDRAIALLPERPEAYFGRALRPTRDPDDRLADLESARSYGLSQRAYHLTRAEIFRVKGEWDRVREEERLAAPFSSTTPIDRFVEARLLRAQGRYDDAAALLEDAIVNDGHDPVQLLARRLRADIREHVGDFNGAIEDLLVVRGGGDHSGDTSARIAHAWDRLGQKEAAEAVVRRTLEETRAQGSVAAWYQLCRSFWRYKPDWYDRATRAGLEAHPDSAVLALHRVHHLAHRARLHDEAIALGKAAVDTSPNDAAAHRALGQALWAAGRSDEAQSSLETALRIARPWEMDGIRSDIALVLTSSGRLKEARELYEDMLVRAPYEPLVLANLGAALLRQGNVDEALAMFEKAAAIEPSNPKRYVQMGAALCALGKHDESLEVFDRAIQLDHDCSDAYTRKAYALRDMKRFPDALEAAERAIAIDPDAVDSRRVRGEILVAMERYPEALAEYDEGIRRHPLEAWLHAGRGDALKGLGRAEDALDAWREAFRLSADVPRYAQLGFILLRLGRYEESAAAYREALRLDDTDAASHQGLGVALQLVGRYEESEKALRNSLRFESDNAKTLGSLAITLAGLGRPEEALAAFRESLRLDAKDPIVYHHFGKLLERLRRYEEALAAYRDAARLDPDNGTYAYEVARGLRFLGRFEEAVAASREAIRLAPNMAEAHCNLGGNLRSLARFEESLAAYRRGHELGSRQKNWSYPSAQWVQRSEALLRLDQKLKRVLRGEPVQVHGQERGFFIDVCRIRKLYGSVARFYAEAFDASPAAAEDQTGHHRYNAACAAVLAGTGQGNDADSLNAEDRKRWREQALEWLRADLAVWKKALADDAGEQARKNAAQMLAHALEDAELSGIRDADSLAALPEEERTAWSTFWEQVRAVRSASQGK